MRLLFFAATAALLTATLSPAAAAQSPTSSSDGRITSDEVVAGIISEIERRLIGDYFGLDLYEEDYGHEKKKGKGKGKGKGKSNELPPGLAKRDSLPPGLQKQLDERGSLPPGLAKRDLPPDLEYSLPRRVSEQFVIVDNDILLVERATGVVLDILVNAVTGGQGRTDN